MKLILFLTLVYAAHLHPERFYQGKWCAEHNGVMEYVLDDGARVDCLTDEYAVEFDFAPKWAESVGQSLYYAEKAGKKPGIVLILEDENDTRYMKRLEKISDKYDIKIWEVKP